MKYRSWLFREGTEDMDMALDRSNGTVAAFGPRVVLVSVLIGILVTIPPGALLNPVGDVEAAPAETILRIGFVGELSTLNPLIAVNDTDKFLASLIYDCLTGVDEDLNATPNLANEWWIVPETDPELVLTGEPFGAVWQYNLTHSATWHDGEPFTAEDVNYTLNLFTENYDAIWSYQPYTFFINYSERIDDYTVRVHFFDRANVSSIPVAFGDTLPIAILPTHIIRNVPVPMLSFSWTNSFPVGTGPFMTRSSTYDEMQAGVNVTLLRNPNYYWSDDYGKQVHFDKLDLRFYQTESLMRAALLNKEIDVARFNTTNFAGWEGEILGGTVTDVATMTGLRPDGYWTDVGFNLRNMSMAPPFERNRMTLDPWLRVSLAMATNKSELVESVYNGYATEGSTLVSPVHPYWHLELGPGASWPYDPILAAAFLELLDYIDTNSDGVREAGLNSTAVQMDWASPGDPLIFQLMVMDNAPEDLEIALALQAEYIAIGVEVEIVLMDYLSFVLDMYGYRYDMMIYHWEQDTDPNMILFIESTYAVAGWSDNSYSLQEYDDNYSASVSELDPASRQVCVQNCQVINYVEAPYIVLAYLNQTYVRRTDTFTGWGDWAAHPGRSLDAKWGANPLIFDLMPAIQNTAPTAAFTVTPSTGTTATTFEFNASGSSDAEDATGDLEVRWDWNNDGVWDTAWSTTKTVQHVFATGGTHSVALIVRDTGGMTDTATTGVIVTDVIPEFTDAFVPVLMVVMLMLAIRRKSRIQS